MTIAFLGLILCEEISLNETGYYLASAVILGYFF
jgi:uncharacterized membrane protein YiaA